MDEQTQKAWDFVKAECPDLESAKVFVRAWSSGQHPRSIGRQEIQVEPGLLLDGTMRSMAALVSLVLEGKDWDNLPMWTNYLDTKHGSTLYHQM